MSEIDDVPLSEPIAAPEIFVDGYHSWMLANGVVTLLATPFLVVLVAVAYFAAAGRTAELERA